MKNRAALTAVIALAAGLPACSSSGSSGSTAAASAKPTASGSGIETIYGKLTGPAVIANNPAIHLTFTGPVATTASDRLGSSVTKGESFTFKTPVGKLAVTFGSPGARTGTLQSAKTCLAVIGEMVRFTVDGSKSTGKFAGATGTGKFNLMATGDLPKLSSGKCLESRNAQLSPKTAVATFTATIKLTLP